MMPPKRMRKVFMSHGQPRKNTDICRGWKTPSVSVRGCPWLKNARGFMLLEIMLAVAIFAIGVIALGWSVNNCLTAETAKNDDQRATQALRNRETEIERGSVIASDSQTTELEGVFTGITVKQTRTPLKLKNENNLDLAGLYQIDLEATWESGGEPQKKTLSFYMLSNQ